MLDIKQFGAVGQGVAVETEAIQSAIDFCSESGEELLISKGVYKTETVFLRDNSKLVFEEGATLSGIPELSAYKDNGSTFVDAVNTIRGKALVVAHNVNNISISGKGTITGNGSEFDKTLKEKPFLVRIVDSANVKISDINLESSVSWCLHIDKCENVDVEGVKIYNRGCENNDGIDIDSCSNVRLINCDVSSGDDAVCLKSTSRKPCTDVFVKNCRISSDCGGFKIGTESVGDFRNIVCEDCYFYDVLACAIKITPTDGATVENVRIKNVVMDNCTGPIFIATGERNRAYSDQGREEKSRIVNFEIDTIKADVIMAPSRGYYNIGIDGGKEGDPEEFLKSLYDYKDWCESIGGIIISGTKDNKLHDITLKNADITLPGGFTDKNHVFSVREMGTLYPEFHRFDPVPAKGIYIRHADGVNIENVKLSYKQEDIREEIIAEDSNNVTIK